MNDKEATLRFTIRRMDIPKQRRDVTKLPNLLWLSRNLGIRNQDSSERRGALVLIRELIREHRKN